MNRNLQVAGNKRMLAFYEATHSSNSLVEAVIKRKRFQARLKERFNEEISKTASHANPIRQQGAKRPH